MLNLCCSATSVHTLATGGIVFEQSAVPFVLTYEQFPSCRPVRYAFPSRLVRWPVASATESPDLSRRHHPNPPPFSNKSLRDNPCWM